VEQQDWFLTKDEMSRLSTSSRNVKEAIERCAKRGLSVEQDAVYKEFYPNVLGIQGKLVRILDCLIQARGLSLDWKDGSILITRVVQYPEGVRLYSKELE